jgi:hypothetical protein
VLCAIGLIALLMGGWEPAAPAFLCFLPVIFFQMCRTIQTLSKWVEALERARQGGHAD